MSDGRATPYRPAKVPSLPSAHAECVRKGEFRAFVGTAPYERRSFTTREEASLWCEGWNACLRAMEELA
jgi:hypothetical protein